MAPRDHDRPDHLRRGSVHPDRERFRALARESRAVAVVREVLADLDTPLATFLKVDDGETAFLLDKASLEQQGFLVRSTSPGVPRSSTASSASQWSVTCSQSRTLSPSP